MLCVCVLSKHCLPLYYWNEWKENNPFACACVCVCEYDSMFMFFVTFIVKAAVVVTSSCSLRFDLHKQQLKKFFFYFLFFLIFWCGKKWKCSPLLCMLCHTKLFVFFSSEHLPFNTECFKSSAKNTLNRHKRLHYFIYYFSYF